MTRTGSFINISRNRLGDAVASTVPDPCKPTRGDGTADGVAVTTAEPSVVGAHVDDQTISCRRPVWHSRPPSTRGKRAA